MRPMKMNINRGSHLPLLIKVMNMTTGPVLELGSGMYSTPYLHYECSRSNRRLVTYESNPDYFYWLEKCKTEFHEVRCISDWNSVDLSEPWDVAFVDHAPAERREHEIRKILHANYIIAHDTENSEMVKYGYHRILNLFKFRWKYTRYRPHTTVFSNRFDVTNFKV